MQFIGKSKTIQNNRRSPVAPHDLIKETFVDVYGVGVEQNVTLEFLNENYSDEDKVCELLALGYLEKVDTGIENSIAKCRDNGEKLIFEEAGSLEALSGLIAQRNFTDCFLFENGVWAKV